MVQFECPWHCNSSVSLELGEFHFLLFLGNKGKCAPHYESQELEEFQNKIGLKGCKWSNLNAPGTEALVSHP